MTNIVKNIILEQLLFENRKQKITDYWISALEKSGLNLRYHYTDTTIKTVIDYLSTQDPSNANKYLDWLTKQVFGNQVSMFSAKMHAELDYYHKNLHRITPDFLNYLRNLENVGLSYATDEKKILKNPKDINSFSNTDSLKFFNENLINFKTKGQLSKEEIESKKVIKLYESPHVSVVVPLTMEASCRYGAGTKWCTAARQENAFEHYNKFNVLIYVIPKNPITPGVKLAIQIPLKQTAPAGYHFRAYDEKDHLIPSKFDMYEILMMYIRDKDNNPLPMEAQDVEKEIWHYFFQQSEN